MIAVFLMLCQVIGAVSIGLLLAMALLSAARVLRDTWREHQLRQREIRALLRSIETVKR